MNSLGANPSKKRKTDGDGDVAALEVQIPVSATTTKKRRTDGPERAEIAKGEKGQEGNLDRRKPIIMVTIEQHQLAKPEEIKEANDKGTRLIKSIDSRMYSKKVTPIFSRHVILDRPEKANEFASKYGPKSRCILFMNNEQVHPNKYNSSAELMDLLHIYNIGNYLPDTEMFFVDISILARDNINNLCENSMDKNYRVVHHIFLHLMVGYDYYRLNLNLNCYNCLKSASTKCLKFP